MVEAHDGIVFRSATLDDLPALVEIHNHYVLNTHVTFDVEPFTVATRRAWFDEHNSDEHNFDEHNPAGRYRIVVAQQGNRILGSASSGRHRPKAAYDTTVETSIACHPDAVGRGLGTRLYQELFAALSGQDIHRAVAGVAQPNDASNALHRKLGFQPLGTYSEVGRKFNRYWDVLWFERSMP